MIVCRVRALLLAVCCAVPVAAFAQPIPPNIEPGMFVADMHALLRASETFRAQCERIAADPRVRVRVSIAYGVEGNGRAQTTFQRYRSGAVFAAVEILFGENYRELLAHEFEHVLEQLDGIDLRREAAAGRAWAVQGGAFETRRAFLVGVQVLHEAQSTHAQPVLLPLR